MNKNDILQIGSLSLSSRLFLGTSQYPNLSILEQALKISKTELVTLALRRVDIQETSEFSFIKTLQRLRMNFLPNTAGCFTAKEAVLTAELAREALQTNRIKLEVIGDDYSLYPDAIELLHAAQELVKKGFEVFPYCTDDVVLCQKLIDCGCVCVMPLASPIGSGGGIQNPNNIKLIRKKISLPIVIDAGIGTASDVCLAFELGADAVLLNTAIAKAGDPVRMASACSHAALAGRDAFLAKRIPQKNYAEASTQNTGKIHYYDMKN